MRHWMLRAMVWYLRRRGGEVNGLVPTHQTERRHRCRYHVVLLRAHHYSELKGHTTWSRGDSL